MYYLGAYKIADSTVSSIVHDQRSNLRRASDLLQIEKGWTGVNCSTHILQLCILKTTRLLIELLQISTLATAELYKQQSQMNMNQQKLKIDCTMR